MSDPTLNFITCPSRATQNARRMAYWQWGDANAAHTVVCVHGLTRQGRDFDVLAQALVDRAPGPIRIICPDVAGRGGSDWLADPQSYAIPHYVGDMLALLTELKPQTLDWVGTSMGGLIGIAVSVHAQAVGASVRRLVLNDVGPVLEWESLLRIGTYLGKDMHFDSLQPMFERAQRYLDDPSLLRSIIADGCDKARKVAQETMRDVREALGLDYD